MSTRRQLSWRARQGRERMREGSRRAAVTCWGDFINPRLVPIKFTFFIIMGATQCVAPFMTLLLRALGLTVQETGFIFTIGPLIPIFAPFVAGITADKIGNFRCILIFSVALSGIVALINVTIPPARTTPEFSENVTFGITCNPGFVLNYTKNKKEGECTFFKETRTIPFMQMKECGYLCPEQVIKYPPQLLKKIKRIKIVQTFNSTLYHICEVNAGKNDDQTTQKCYRKNLNKSRSYENMPRTFSLHNLIIPFPEIDKQKFVVPITNSTMSPDQVLNFDCAERRVPKSIDVQRITITDGPPDISEAGTNVTCHFHCKAFIPHNHTCEERPMSIEHNVVLSFWLFVTVNVLSKLLIGFTYTLFEVAVVAILKEYGYDYGLQRIYGSIGGMVFAPLSGFFIDHFGKDGHYSDYYVMFFLYCILKIICAVILAKVDLQFKAPARSICENIGNIFRNLEILLLIIVVFISGMCYGFIENFLPWHLRDLGATNWFIGLLTTIASVAALPFLAFSGAICKKFGNFQTISFGLVCYSIRCIGYSLITDYYWCATFEVLEGVTTGLLIASAIIYGAQLASRSCVATLQGILATFHYGLGKAVGSLLGGFLMHKVKAKYAFQIFSGIALTSGFCYYLLGKLIILPRQTRKLKRRQEVMAMPIQTISRKEHKRLSAFYLDQVTDVHEMEGDSDPKHSPLPITEDSTLQYPEREEGLDETQMTDLPPDYSIANIDESVVKEDDQVEDNKE